MASVAPNFFRVFFRDSFGPNRIHFRLLYKITDVDAFLYISPYSSLNFDNKWKQPEQQGTDYKQKFIVGDYAATVQYAVPKGNDASWTSLDLVLYLLGEEGSAVVPSVVVGETDQSTVYNAIVPLFFEGCFRAAFEKTDNYGNVSVVRECYFEVLTGQPEEDENQLMLFRYANDENKDGTVFASDFYFRCEGKYFPQNEEYNVEGNDFRDQNYDLSLLSAEASTAYGLTIGGSQGVPTWVARKLNYIFSCTEIHVGESGKEEHVVRVSDGSVERTNLGDMNPRYLFNINLEKVTNGADSVKIGTFTPIELEITPVWIEIGAGELDLHDIAVTAPDDAWTVSVGDPSWAAANKIDSTRATIQAITNNTDQTDRTQEITFTRTNPDTGEVYTRVLTLTQAGSGTELNNVTWRGYIKDAQTGAGIEGASVTLGYRIGETTFAPFASLTTNSSGYYEFSGDVSEFLYLILSRLYVDGEKQGFIRNRTFVTVPDYQVAITDGVTCPDVNLVRS